MLKSSTSGDLLTAASLRGICDFVDKLILPNIPVACPAVSVASRLAELRNKTCSQINAGDVSFARDLLDVCVPFYKSGKLKPNMTSEEADSIGVPTRCRRTDFVYDVMYYFADVGFYDKSNDLLYTMVYIHYMHRYGVDNYKVDETFYKDHVHWKTLDNNIVQLVTVGFQHHDHIKYTLFEGYLISDLTYFGLAFLLIAIFTLVYLLSFVLVIGTFVNIFLSFGLAYFCYYYVCQMVFYPFINLLALLLLIAVAADDVFVFYDTWQQVKTEHPSWTADQHLSVTFSHAITSIFVTSFTTAAAFLANVVSNITAIQCFGIFAALSIVANFVMMVTIMPALVIATEWCAARVPCPCRASMFGAFYRIPNTFYSWLMTRLRSVFHTAIPAVIRRAWWFCITVGVAIGLTAVLTIFYKPALKPPTTKEFQLFKKDNILEKWDFDFKHRFPAEIAAANEKTDIYLTFLFGFKATDPGNRLNPDDKTKSLSRDGDFNLEKTKTQNWLRKFCDSVTDATFAKHGVESRPCLVTNDDVYRHVVGFACSYIYMLASDNTTAEFKKICCLVSVNTTVLQHCAEWSRQQRLLTYYTGIWLRYNTTGSPVYHNSSESNDNSVLGYRFDVRTNLSYSFSYEKMRTSYEVVSSFMKTQLKSAPVGLRSGFVSGRGAFEFYDLQQSIASGTFTSVCLSIGVSFIVLLLTVRNVLITIYAMVTIILAIACTVSSIVLMGWKLNIIESMTITLAVGMSIDFTIHYGVVYQMSPEATSAGRTYESFVRVGSAVAAAAWTTFSAGIAVLNCSVDPYRKLGIFLVLVMVFSWTYSTFFFQSLCHIIGPVGKSCQIPCPTTRVGGKKNRNNVSDMDQANNGAI